MWAMAHHSSYLIASKFSTPQLCFYISRFTTTDKFLCAQVKRPAWSWSNLHDGLYAMWTSTLASTFLVLCPARNTFGALISMLLTKCGAWKPGTLGCQTLATPTQILPNLDHFALSLVKSLLSAAYKKKTAESFFFYRHLGTVR